MTLNQVYNKVKEVATNHRQVRTVKEGLPDEWLHDDVKDVVYPAVFFTGLSSATQQGARTYTFNVVIVDRTQEEDQNEMEQLSDCQSIADDLISQMAFGNQPWELDKNVSTEYIRYALEDICSGVSFTITLLIPFAFDACDLPSNYTLPNAGYVYISPDRFRTLYDFIVSGTSPIITGGNSLTNNLFEEPPFLFINGQLINYEASANMRYLVLSGTTLTIMNGGVLEGEHVFIISDSISQINTNRFMTIEDFIVGSGEPMEDGDTTYQNNLLTVPPFVFIGGQLLGYSISNDRRYVSHNASTKTITINNGGVLNDESVRIVL